MAKNKARLIWSPESEDDLIEIWLSGAARFSPASADRHVRKIKAMAAKLSNFPRMGRSRDELKAGIRSLAEYPSVVFYRLTEEAVEIVRVVDGRRNLAAVFSRDGE